MKKTLLVALAVIGFGAASAKADVAFGVSFGSRYSSRACAPVYTAPVVVAQPVYRHYAPVVVAAPAYCPPPAPVCAPVYTAPVCAPAPVYYSYPAYRPSYHSYGYRSHHGYSHGRSHGSVHVRW